MIAPGIILMGKDTLRPRCFQLEDATYPHAWMSVKHNLNSYELELELATGGWTFFYMANAMRATACGFNRSRMIRAALKRLITDARKQRCNALEIDDVETRSFLGIPYVSISAHPRHMQKGMVFNG